MTHTRPTLSLYWLPGTVAVWSARTGVAGYAVPDVTLCECGEASSASGTASAHALDLPFGWCKACEVWDARH